MAVSNRAPLGNYTTGRNEEMQMKRRPLLKGTAPALTPAERLDMLHRAARAIEEQANLDPRLKARGLAPLRKARRRLQRELGLR